MPTRVLNDDAEHPVKSQQFQLQVRHAYIVALCKCVCVFLV